MTSEIDYLTQERLGILLDGRREPTEDEVGAAYFEAVAIVMRSKDRESEPPQC